MLCLVLAARPSGAEMTTPDFFNFFKLLLMWFAWAMLSVAALPARLAAVSSNLAATNAFRMRRIALPISRTSPFAPP